MIVETSAGLGIWGILPLAIAAICAAGFFFLIFIRAIIPALGVAVVGAGALATPIILASASKADERPFEVIVISDTVSESGFLHHQGLVEGEYRASSGKIFPLHRDAGWPHLATLIINDSRRLVTLRRYHYAAASDVRAGSPLLEVVFPGETAVVEGYVNAMEDEGTPPPQSIASQLPVDMLDILYRSEDPYEPERDGSREDLLAKRQRP